MSLMLLSFHSSGIYCEAGDFFIDPWRPVDRAIITHAHSDHARWGMKHYLAHRDSLPIMRHRLGEIDIQGMHYGAPVRINGVTVSLHPAGHIIGSSQVRVEHKGEVWVVSGDYKTTTDATCTPFEPISCHHFITESTFGLPVFHWEHEQAVYDAINAWWRNCQDEGKNAVLFAYSLGKAQRILRGVDGSIGPIVCHGAVENTNAVLRQAGMVLPPTIHAVREHQKGHFRGALILAPPSANGTSWMKRFQPFETGFASGWMQLRGARRRRNFDRGFVLSDHADWPGLLQAIEATGASNIHVTHGYTELFAAYLNEIGYNASAVRTEFGTQEEDTPLENE